MQTLEGSELVEKEGIFSDIEKEDLIISTYFQLGPIKEVKEEKFTCDDKKRIVKLESKF